MPEQPDDGNSDRRLFSPSTARNREVLREVFLDTMPSRGHLLEIGSGSGEHAAFIAPSVPDLIWLPGDLEADRRASIVAWTDANEVSNIAPPHSLDVTEADWAAQLRRNSSAPLEVVGVVSINVVHIAPIEAAEGLFRGSGELLEPNGRLLLYGPFLRQGEHTAPSNADFDRWLKAKDPRFGVRDLDLELVPLASQASLELAEVVKMPANNLIVIFERQSS